MFRRSPAGLGRVALLALAYLTVTTFVGVVHAAGGFAGPERGSVDLRFRVRGPQPPDPRILIVAVDDRTVAAVDRMPPIPRGLYARALDRLHAGGARLIVVDVQFSGAGPSPADDDALVAAITRNGPVVLMAPDFRGPAEGVPAGRSGTAGAVLAAAGVDPDPDGVLRTMMYQQVNLPTIPVRAARMLAGDRRDDGFTANHALIDFRGGPGTFPTVSLIDLLEGDIPPSRIAGSIVLVGVTAPSQKDVFLTAASPVPLSGVEIHANALHTLLHGVPLRPVPPAADLALLLIAAALPLLAAARWPAPRVLITMVPVLAVLLGAVQFAFTRGRVLAPVPALAALLTATAAAVAIDALVERRRRHALEVALRDFVRPADADFFLSYRHDQSSFAAGAIRRELVLRFGEHSVFMDTARLSAGQQWPKQISEAIRGCSVMLVLIGPHWAQARFPDGGRRLDDPGDWVRREVAAGLRQPETVVVPVLLDGAAMPAGELLPDDVAALGTRQAFALSGDRLGPDVDDLVQAVQRVRRAAQPQTTGGGRADR
ncbi:CHASE2 domain-containing protein [Actinoplanes sp. NBRC 101535]|uniref:CHASE2 domain-containing protein n=1 Tax=Actinoplanes sp. NBRC 101535 TaxID=3032196 RepID=UPI0024A5BE36|nr:CHASE2 domain-containing protein [Actinoplanes sp. NBRC 101535]GLY03918.1 hypothetical protein Acsp01_42970 [Actinoplanes sp. NBRC 101535]